MWERGRIELPTRRYLLSDECLLVLLHESFTLWMSRWKVAGVSGCTKSMLSWRGEMR